MASRPMRCKDDILLLLLFLLAFSSIGHSIIILSFDGSLRPPTDPGYPTHLQEKRAACAASIHHVVARGSVDKTMLNDCNRVLWALGGQVIPNAYSCTSAEVEYQGLLFGLRGLSKFWDHLMVSADTDLVIIRGDCKTVLQQISGRARPRRLEKYYNEAVAILSEQFSGRRIEFQHVPRHENSLCDRMCARILADCQAQAYKDAVIDLDSLTMSAQQYLSTYLRIESNQIPFSYRPAFYRTLACHHQEDPQSIHLIGEWWEQEVRILDRKDLLVETVLLQLRGLETSGIVKRADALRRKFKKILFNGNEKCLIWENSFSPTAYDARSQVPNLIENSSEWPSSALRWILETRHCKTGQDMWFRCFDELDAE